MAEYFSRVLPDLLSSHTLRPHLDCWTLGSFPCSLESLRAARRGALRTYHAGCMSRRPGGRRADAVGVARADSWREGGRGPAGRRFDSLLLGRGRGLLTVHQGQPQGRQALLLTGRGRSGVESRERAQKHTCRGGRTHTAGKTQKNGAVLHWPTWRTRRHGYRLKMLKWLAFFFFFL